LLKQELWRNSKSNLWDDIVDFDNDYYRKHRSPERDVKRKDKGVNIMSNMALFVDLPNFYSRLLKSGIEDPKTLKDYFLNWLDFDLLARSLTETYTGIWVFYSGERIGPSSERIEGKHLQEYISRINGIQGVTAHDVNIPGEQREHLHYKCDNCGHEGRAQDVSEKGIDASLTVHMFDTMESWDTAYLFSGDADFVPAVESLRRRGKIVIGVGFHDASQALVRECFDYIFLDDVFLTQDLLLYSLLRKGGIAEKWLTDEVKPFPSSTDFKPIDFSIHAGSVLMSNPYYKSGFISATPNLYYIDFIAKGAADLTERNSMMTSLTHKYQNIPRVRPTKEYGGDIPSYKIDYLDFLSRDSILRHFETLAAGIENLYIQQSTENSWYVSARYVYEPKDSQYKLVFHQP
jgi:uncharacterized LabA/DUF88 family protein